jgi:hypothetical protein
MSMGSWNPWKRIYNGSQTDHLACLSSNTQTQQELLPTISRSPPAHEHVAYPTPTHRSSGSAEHEGQGPTAFADTIASDRNTGISHVSLSLPAIQDSEWSQGSDRFTDDGLWSTRAHTDDNRQLFLPGFAIGSYGSETGTGSSPIRRQTPEQDSEWADMPPSLRWSCRKKSGHWTCVTCNERFPSTRALERHAVMEGRNHHAFRCLHPDCRYTSLRYKALGRHFDSTHAAQKKHPCTLCDHAGFGRKDALKVHMRKEHPQAWDDIEKAYPKYCSEPGCDFGTKAYDSELEWLQHVRTYHGKGKWSCPAEGCSRKGMKGYTRERDLNSHVLELHPSLFKQTIRGAQSTSSTHLTDGGVCC